MNILQLTIDYPPPLSGGLPRQVHGLSHALASHHSIGVVASGLTRDDGPVRVFGADPLTEFLPSRDLSSLARVNIGLVRALVEADRAGAWDIIHAHDWMVAPAAVVAKHLLGVPLVASIHTDAAATAVGTADDRLRRLDWESALAGITDLLLAVSTPVRDLMIERYPGVPARFLPNGIDLAPFTTNKTGRALHRVLFVGRLVPYKGCQDAIRALGLLRTAWPDVQLEIIGDGYYRPDLEALVTGLGLEHKVIFSGWREGDALVEAYERATIVVVPSREEAFGIVAIEAMAAGAPVIATSIPAFASYIDHGRTGLLATPADPGALANQIDRLLRDAGLRTTLARNARRDVVPNHAWTRVVAAAESAYRDALAM